VLPLRDENPTARRAIVTFALIVVNLGIYFGIQFPKSDQAQTAFEYRWAAVPCEINTGKPIVAVPDTAATPPNACVVPAGGINAPQTLFPHKSVWLALFFSMFLHASILHVLGNMLFLWIFGNNVEDQLGHVWYLVLYLVGGLAASFVYVAGNVHSVDPVIGASGAIAVVMGAYIVWWPRARILTLVTIIPLYLPAMIVLGFWFMLQFFTSASSGVATLVHIAGFIIGIVVAFALRAMLHYPRPVRRGPSARAL